MAFRGKSRGTVRRMSGKVPMVARGLPKIPVHSSATIHAQLPDFTSTERSNTGVSPIRGNLTGAYPKIKGFNGGPGGSLEQPLVTQTWNGSGYL